MPILHEKPLDRRAAAATKTQKLKINLLIMRLNKRL
jgi:hypothetical protein